MALRLSLEARSTVLRDLNGVPIAMRGITTDITQAKQNQDMRANNFTKLPKKQLSFETLL